MFRLGSSLLVVFAALMPLPGCYSLLCSRVDVCVTTRKQLEVVVLHAWIAEGELRTVSFESVMQTLAAYPADVLFSTYMALMAPFDPTFDVRFGPVGALAGITLPGLTLMGPLKVAQRGGGWVVPENEFESLRGATKEGRRRVNEVLRSLRDVWGEDWLSVEFVEVRRRLPAEDKWLALHPDHNRWAGNPPWR